MRFNLKEYNTKRNVLNNLAFLHDRAIRGTNTASALSQMRNEVFSYTNGDRSQVDNIAIVMTDGQSNVNTPGTLEQATLARNEGVLMLAVGIGNNVNRQEVEGITSDTNRAFYASNQDQLQRVANQILDVICI